MTGDTNQQLAEKVVMKLRCISRRELDDRSLTPGEADALLARLNEAEKACVQRETAGSSSGRTSDFESDDPGSNPGPAVGLWDKIRDQQARLRKLERTYATVKGDLRVQTARAEAADRLKGALRNITHAGDVEHARELARAALSAGGDETEVST